MSLLSLCASAHNTVFSFLKEPLSLPFSLSMASFVSKKCRYAKNLHQPLEPFQLKLILSYMAHRTFSSKWHLQASCAHRSSGLGAHQPRWELSSGNAPRNLPDERGLSLITR